MQILQPLALGTCPKEKLPQKGPKGPLIFSKCDCLHTVWTWAQTYQQVVKKGVDMKRCEQNISLDQLLHVWIAKPSELSAETASIWRGGLGCVSSNHQTSSKHSSRLRSSLHNYVQLVEASHVWWPYPSSTYVNHTIKLITWAWLFHWMINTCSCNMLMYIIYTYIYTYET